MSVKDCDDSERRTVPDEFIPDEPAMLGSEPERWIECHWCKRKYATEEQFESHLLNNSEVWPHPALTEEHLESVPALVRCSCGDKVEGGEPFIQHSQDTAGEHEVVSLVEVLE